MTEGIQCNKCHKFIPKFKPAPKKERTVGKPREDADLMKGCGLTDSFSITYTLSTPQEFPTEPKKDSINIDLCAECAKKLDKWLGNSS